MGRKLIGYRVRMKSVGGPPVYLGISTVAASYDFKQAAMFPTYEAAKAARDNMNPRWATRAKIISVYQKAREAR
jgi:hypothetical protein